MGIIGREGKIDAPIGSTVVIDNQEYRVVEYGNAGCQECALAYVDCSGCVCSSGMRRDGLEVMFVAKDTEDD